MMKINWPWKKEAAPPKKVDALYASLPPVIGVGGENCLEAARVIGLMTGAAGVSVKMMSAYQLSKKAAQTVFSSVGSDDSFEETDVILGVSPAEVEKTIRTSLEAAYPGIWTAALDLAFSAADAELFILYDCQPGHIGWVAARQGKTYILEGEGGQADEFHAFYGATLLPAVVTTEDMFALFRQVLTSENKGMS